MKIPEGWQLVPVEPTDDMLGELYGSPLGRKRQAFVSAYQDMLAAAPKPSTASPADEARI